MNENRIETLGKTRKNMKKWNKLEEHELQKINGKIDIFLLPLMAGEHAYRCVYYSRHRAAKLSQIQLNGVIDLFETFYRVFLDLFSAEILAGILGYSKLKIFH